MILPSKHVRLDRSLVGIGADILHILRQPMTMSALWDKIRERPALDSKVSPISYSWFVLALNMLYMIGVIDYDKGLLKRVEK